ncbi:MAG: arsenic efflux protein [Bacilli bacterium]|nr:arsenic efflux protein [Bacilli bacterium]
MLDVIIDTLLDTVKLIPFLFVAFLLLEAIEHKLSRKSQNKIAKAGRLGPLFGSLLGAIPQCGFSTMATNLYGARVITLGSLIAIYLSTSDEMLPIMLGENVPFILMLKIIITKVVIGMIAGFIIDFVMHKKETYHIKDICEEEHCHCEHGILRSSLKHTLNITLFILLTNFVLNSGMHYLGEDRLSELFLKDNFFGPFISSLIGLIPNCGASVMITELYLNDAITIGSCIAGLLTGSGVALLLLFKVNHNLKENLSIIGLLYAIGVISGVIIDIII